MCPLAISPGVEYPHCPLDEAPRNLATAAVSDMLLENVSKREPMSTHKTKYTPSEALRTVAGLHRKRLYEMMSHGDISYLATDQGKREIDGAELARVFGDKFRPLDAQALGAGNVETPHETGEKHLRNTQLELEVHLLRERLAAREQMVEAQEQALQDVREERDAWRQMAQSLQKQTQPLFLPEGPAPQPPKRSFWRRMFGERR